MTSLSTRLKHQPKVLATYHKLLEIIKDLETDAKLPTAATLRTQLGVSTETLNLAIRELEREHLIYSVRGIGIFVAPSRHTIILCDPSHFEREDISPFWQMLLDAAQAYADEKNENFKLHFVRPRGYKGDPLPADVRDILQARKISGVFGVGLLQEVVDTITATNVPLLAYAGPGQYNVHFEVADTTSLGVPELARRGCHKIAMWRPWRYTSEGPEDFDDFLSKDDSFRIALEYVGLSPHPEMVRVRDYFGVLSADSKPLSYQEQGFRLATEVFCMPLHKRPDGIIIHDDMMARGVLEVCELKNINVGRDIFIVTMSNKNSPVLRPYEEKLLRVEYDPAKLVEEMFRLLQEIMRVRSPSPRSVAVRGHLVVGAKVGLSRISASHPCRNR